MAIHIFATGTSRGIGNAILDRFGREDVRVVGHRSSPVDGDASVVADPTAPRRAWDQALEALDGRIDVLVNNAGIFEAVSIDAPDAAWTDAWSRTMQINLQASADLCRLAVLHFRRPGGVAPAASSASPPSWA